jgi:hypothetical protein
MIIILSILLNLVIGARVAMNRQQKSDTANRDMLNLAASYGSEISLTNF